MERRSLMRMAGIGLVGSAALAIPFITPRARASNSWTAFSAQPAGSASVRGLERLASQLSTATRGEFTMRVKPIGTVPVNVTNLINGVATGALDLAEDPFYSGPVPAGGLVRLPMLVNTPADHKLAASALRPYLDSALAKRDVTYLGSARFAAQCLWSRRKITGMNDISNLRIRVAVPEQAELVRRYNGVAVTMAITEVPAALESGSIDAVFGAAATTGSAVPESWKTSFVAGYTGYQGYLDSAFIANPQAYANLGRDFQTALTQAMAEITEWIVATRDEEEATARESLRKAGVTITDGTDEDRAVARMKLAPYWRDWAIPRGREAVEQLATMRKTLGR